MFVGAVLGAGFATGQEVYRFFVRYGLRGLAGATLSIALLWLLCLGVLRLGRHRPFADLYDFLTHCCGETVGMALHGVFIAFLFVVFGVMGSSAGALAQEAWGLPQLVGFGGYLIGMMALLLRGEEGMSALFSLLTPMMTVGMVILCLYVLVTRDVATFAMLYALELPGGFLLSALLYFGYNSILSTSVLCTLERPRRQPGWERRTALLCAGGFGLCLLVLYGALLAFYQEIAGLEIPMLYIASLGGEKIQRLYTVVLLCAILTTGAGCGYVLCRSMGHSRWGILVLCAGSVAFSVCDFSFLIHHLYGAFGVLGLALSGAVLMRAAREG